MSSVYTVSQINKYINRIFKDDAFLKNVYVKGEVSNCKYHDSGHIYFTLKDGASQISCVMFAGRRAGISFRLENGFNVMVYGSIETYEAGGVYQIYASQITRDGIGKLYEEYEALKKKLEAEGLFLREHKKPIPQFVKRVGVVTARTGAAVRDIIQISARRNPYVQLILYPAKVQGEGSAKSVIDGIKYMDGKVDVIIVGRGGGSIEDLWAFNEECVARAIYDCETPVISAVGHETDTTIADYVSDLRAPTPSAAAELAVFDINTLYVKL
ncbi:MAG: exodeoxyribonuclease VII large subunit, partial [Lachnospiraceae bacterium]|nr:exodeoxyribonuclease VII large subunit [Lachnospiraceae bacterium]